MTYEEAVRSLEREKGRPLDPDEIRELMTRYLRRNPEHARTIRTPEDQCRPQR